MRHRHETVPYSYKHLTEAGFTLDSAWITYERYPSWSILCDDQLVMCGGFIKPHPGLIEAWAIPGPKFRTHAKLAFRESMDALEWNVDGSVRRIQAIVIAGHSAGVRWAQHLGFERESVMHRYGRKGEDVEMYVFFPGGWSWTAD